MNDRQLLELAAKALGIGAYVYCDTHMGMIPKSEDDYVFPFNVWNPLADDGDALRLAVKLNIGIRSHGADHWHNPSSSVALYEVGDDGGRVTVEHGDDPSFSTRRAIVRAAAAIGKMTS